MFYWKCKSCGLEIEFSPDSMEDNWQYNFKKCPNLNCGGEMDWGTRA